MHVRRAIPSLPLLPRPSKHQYPPRSSLNPRFHRFSLLLLSFPTPIECRYERFLLICGAWKAANRLQPPYCLFPGSGVSLHFRVVGRIPFIIFSA